MKKLLCVLMFVGALYSQCDESNWQGYYPFLDGCFLTGAIFSGFGYGGPYLEGACLEGAIGFTQTNYYGTPILEGCADTWGSDCSYEDANADGYDDVSYDAGATSGDLNLDGTDNVLDVVILVGNILNP